MTNEDNKIAASADAKTELARIDNAQRQARWRARKDLQIEGATIKGKLQILANRKSALSATLKAADKARETLTPEQRAIFESELFIEGAADGSSVGLKFLQSMMYDVIEYVKADLFDEIRADWIMEAYQDFILTFPFAKPLAFPRSLAPVDDGEREYPVSDFHAAVTKYSAHRNVTPIDIPCVPEPKRGRGRPRKVPVETTPNDAGAALIASWSRPNDPNLAERNRERAARAVDREVAEALPSRPPALYEPGITEPFYSEPIK